LSGIGLFYSGTTAYQSPSEITYSITPSSTTLNRTLSASSGVTYTINTTGVSNGTILYWTNSGTATSSDVIQATGTTASICATANENSNAVLTPANSSYYITSVTFASFGNPTGSCGSFVYGGCNSVTSQSVVQSLALYKNTATSIEASTALFGDPCNGTAKRLYVQVVTTLYTGYTSGQVTITNNTASFTVEPATFTQVTGASAATFIVNLRTGSNAGPIVKTATTVNLPAVAQYICATANEGGTLSITAPVGTTFRSILFASYGNPTGTCGTYALGSCHAPNSLTVVQTALLTKSGTQTITVSNAVFGGDPCSGTSKRLYVSAECY
jgi:hypothetical protein